MHAFDCHDCDRENDRDYGGLHGHGHVHGHVHGRDDDHADACIGLMYPYRLFQIIPYRQD